MSSGRFSSLMYPQIDDAGLRVEADGRLVKEQHARGVQQPARDLQPSFHAARERPHQALAPVPQTHHLQHLPHAVGDGGLGDAVQLGVEAQVLSAVR